jgi:hypothetical protein
MGLHRPGIPDISVMSGESAAVCHESAAPLPVAVVVGDKGDQREDDDEQDSEG